MDTGRHNTEVAVFVRGRGADKAVDAALLTEAVERITHTPRVRIEQHCPHCGSLSHGRPLVVSPPHLVDAVHVSLSRAGGLVAVAVSSAGPVGIDIEEFAAVQRAGFDDVAFSAAERMALLPLRGIAADRARASMWTGKEAVLKLTGEGLRTDPRKVEITLDGATSCVSSRSEIQLLGFEPGPGLVGTIAVQTGRPPRLTLH